MAVKTESSEAQAGGNVWKQMEDRAAQIRAEVTSRLKGANGGKTPSREEITGDKGYGGAAKWLDSFNAYNKSIANCLEQLQEQPQDIQGRDREMALLVQFWERPITPVALLIAPAGAGKTAIVEECVKRANRGDFGRRVNRRYMLLQLRTSILASLDPGKAQATLATVFSELAKYEKRAQKALKDDRIRMVLFIDEVHTMVTIFGANTKVGGDAVKDILARTPIRIVAATTRREYDSTIAVDLPFAERFKNIELREVSADIVRSIARNWWEKVAPDCKPITDEVIDYVIESNHIYRPQSAEPRKTLDVLEDLVAYERTSGKVPDKQTVVDIFKQRFSVRLKMDFDADAVFAEVTRRVKGQPAALNVLDLLLHATAFKVRQNVDAPIFTALMTGSTGVGKTETTKAIAESVYPGEKALYTINMPDYSTPDMEPLFRKELGETLRHSPNSVILFDEFEKAAANIKMSMLYILDEGIVNYTVVNREGREEVHSTSLRNSIVIATTNAGASVFDDDNKYNRATGQGEIADYVEQAQVDRLLTSLKENLMANGFPPEMLGRFDQIVPYRALSEQTSLDILTVKLDEMLDGLRTEYGYDVVVNEKVRWDEKQYDCIASDVVVYIAFECAKIRESNSGGARALMRELDTTVFYALVRAFQNNPGSRRFKLTVAGVESDRGPDGVAVYRMDNEIKRGVVVEPLD